MSDLTAESAEEFTQSLSQVFAGSYRQILWAQQQGEKPCQHHRR